MVIDKTFIKRIFDLKGSRVERKTKNIEKCDNLKTLKDLDFLWMTKVEDDVRKKSINKYLIILIYFYS